MTTKLEQLFIKAKELPINSGCYMMKNIEDEILYIGKANNLRKRVQSYFNRTLKNPKTMQLISQVNDFEFILTENEREAFVLENNLIKKHLPKYNIRLKDDSSFPYVVIDKMVPFPRVQCLRRPKRKLGRLIVGPFAVGSGIYSVTRILTKCFGLRDCSLREFNSRKTPCLLYQLKHCSGPCVGLINQTNYEKNLGYVIDFLKGKTKKVIKIVKERMLKAADSEDFEYAAILRDFMEQLVHFSKHSMQQNVEFYNEKRDLDFICFTKDENEVDLSIYMVRSGRVLGQKNLSFSLERSIHPFKEELKLSILSYYYSSIEKLPSIVFQNFLDTNTIEDLEHALSSIREDSHNLKFLGPPKKYLKIMKLVQLQAKEAQKLRLKRKKEQLNHVIELKEFLNLKKIPHYIECLDIAIWQGHSPAAAFVSFFDGVPNKSDYRHYHIESREEGNNDFAMIQEAIRKRLRSGRSLDLLIVDGGRPQLQAAQKELDRLKVDLPLLGIAKEKKEKGKVKYYERLVQLGRPTIEFEETTSLIQFIGRLRDEAHRFSRRLHHKTEKSRVFGSWFDDIKGIGPKLKQKILMKLEDQKVGDLYNYSELELQEKLDISSIIAKKIYEKLRDT